jgi:hypothetical protein
LAGIPASLYGGIASASGGSLSKYVSDIVLITLAITVIELIFTSATYIATYTKDVFTFPLINIQDTSIIWVALTVAVAVSVLAGYLYLELAIIGFWSRVREFLGDPSTIDYYIKIAEDLKSRVDDCCSCCGCCSQLVREWVDKVLEDTKSQLEDIKRRGLLEMIKKTR